MTKGPFAAWKKQVEIRITGLAPRAVSQTTIPRSGTSRGRLNLSVLAERDVEVLKLFEPVFECEHLLLELALPLAFLLRLLF